METLKQRMEAYWTQRADDFSQQRLKEFEGKRHDLWMKELEKYIPMDRSLDILDIGTGPGFFAALLASRGHHVTGIDLTPDMIRAAKKMSGHLGIHADFYVMDAEKPEFVPESFDVIVSRNLTWTLPHMDKAYQAWYKLLRKDGFMVNFDGDYCREKPMEVSSANHAHEDLSAEMVEEYECLKADLRNVQRPRPQWDQELLKAVGFSKIQVDTSLWQRIYGVKDEFYYPTPIFTIAAYV